MRVLEKVVLLVASRRLINVVDNEFSRYLIWEISGSDLLLCYSSFVGQMFTKIDFNRI